MDRLQDHDAARLSGSLLPEAAGGGLLLIDLDAQGCATGTYAGDVALLRELGLATPPRPADDLIAQLHPTFARVLKAALAACSLSDRAVAHVMPGARTGAEVLVEMTVVSRWRDGAAAPVGFCLTVRDASSRIAQRRMLDRLAQVATRTSNLVVITNAERRIEWVNEAFTQASGYTLEEARGQSPGQLLQFEGTSSETIGRIRRALNAHQPIQAEILNRSKSGREYWLLLDIQPMLDARGQLDGFVAVQTDVSEDRAQKTRLTELAHQAELARSTLRSAVNALPDGFALYDAEERLLFCNDRYRALHPGAEDILEAGVTLESVFRRETALGIYPTARGCESAWLSRTIESIRASDEWSAEIELTDGRWVRSVKRHAPGGRLIGLRSDITRLKEAELSAVSQRVAAMDASHDGIAVADVTGRLVYINPALLRMSGTASGEVWLGRAWCELFDSVDRDRMASEARRALDAAGFWRSQVCSRQSDGEMHDQEVTLTRTPDETLVLISRDISERLRYEAERDRLNEVVVFERVAHEARLERALVETRRLHERDRQLREASDMLLKALQSLSAAEDVADGPQHLLRQLADALGTRRIALLPLAQEEQPLCLEDVDWWLALGGQGKLVDYLARKPRRMISDVSALPPLDSMATSGALERLGWLLTARVEPARKAYLLVAGGEQTSTLDHGKAQIFTRFVPLLTEALRRSDEHLRARQLERDLQQAHKMESLGTLAGGIAHEINTPMQFISDNLHFLRDAFGQLISALNAGRRTDADTPGGDGGLSYALQEVPLAIEQSLAGSQRVAELVEAIRTFAYPELVRIEVIDLQEMLEHCLVITRSTWKHDVAVSLDCAQAIAPIQGSPGQISQVFINLTTNACDAARMTHASRGGIVRLSLAKSGDEIVVHVDDNGPGVPADLRDRIFDPFFTTKGVGKGTGQGLGISRSIIERHGGRIDVGDSPLGGARFSVRFAPRLPTADVMPSQNPETACANSDGVRH
ncbi:MAG: PAS domain S-box protein [Betaproteobacteria bacterium]